MCPRCGKTVYAAEKVVGGGNVRKKSCSRNVQSCFKIKVDDDLKHFFHGLFSHGIRAVFAVPNVEKDWSPQPLLIEMGRSTVKVCV